MYVCLSLLIKATAVLQEINLMEKLSFDRNIVQFYGAVLSAPAPMLVLEFMEGEHALAAHNFPFLPMLFILFPCSYSLFAAWLITAGLHYCMCCNMANDARQLQHPQYTIVCASIH